MQSGQSGFVLAGTVKARVQRGGGGRGSAQGMTSSQYLIVDQLMMGIEKVCRETVTKFRSCREC